MQHTIYLHEDLIDAEGISETMTFLLEAFGVFRTELVAPESDGFVTDFDATFME